MQARVWPRKAKAVESTLSFISVFCPLSKSRQQTREGIATCLPAGKVANDSINSVGDFGENFLSRLVQKPWWNEVLHAPCHAVTAHRNAAT